MLLKQGSGYAQSLTAQHVIPLNDGFSHVEVSNTCPCGPRISESRIIHNRHREYTKAEEERIRCGDAYDDDDDDEISDAIIARGTFEKTT